MKFLTVQNILSIQVQVLHLNGVTAFHLDVRIFKINHKLRLSKSSTGQAIKTRSLVH